MKSLTLTEADARKWRNKIEQLEDEILGLRRKLELFELVTAEKSNTGHKKTTSEPQKTHKYGAKSTLVLKILADKQRYLAPLEIKDVMRERGVRESEWGEKYIYVHQTLRRLLKSGRIKKSPTANKYKISE